MAPVLPRANLINGLNSSRFVRLLAEFAAPAGSAKSATKSATKTGASGAPSPSKQSFTERLGQWLDWTDAIALAAALNRETAARPLNDRSAAAAQTVADELVQVRNQLADAIMADGLFGSGQRPVKLAKPVTGAARVVAPEVALELALGVAPEPAPEFAAYHRACLAHQRAMAAGLAPLRGRVRQALTALSPALGRLAALDAVFDEALGKRERHLLSTVPVLLQQRFERLRQAHSAADCQAPGARSAADRKSPAPWLAEVARDMQQVLLAELDLRLQPIEGMVEAMGDVVVRRSTGGHHEVSRRQ